MRHVGWNGAVGGNNDRMAGQSKGPIITPVLPGQVACHVCPLTSCQSYPRWGWWDFHRLLPSECPLMHAQCLWFPILNLVFIPSIMFCRIYRSTAFSLLTNFHHSNLNKVGGLEMTRHSRKHWKQEAPDEMQLWLEFIRRIPNGPWDYAKLITSWKLYSQTLL